MFQAELRDSKLLVCGGIVCVRIQELKTMVDSNLRASMLTLRCSKKPQPTSNTPVFIKSTLLVSVDELPSDIANVVESMPHSLCRLDVLEPENPMSTQYWVARTLTRQRYNRFCHLPWQLKLIEVDWVYSCGLEEAELGRLTDAGVDDWVWALELKLRFKFSYFPCSDSIQYSLQCTCRSPNPLQNITSPCCSLSMVENVRYDKWHRGETTSEVDQCKQYHLGNLWSLME